MVDGKMQGYCSWDTFLNLESQRIVYSTDASRTSVAEGE